MKKRFTETQIVSAIKKQESGMAFKDICREFGISDATFYNWKAKYGGMEASDIYCPVPGFRTLSMQNLRKCMLN